MKKNNKSYAAPKTEIIEIQPVSILMSSGGGGGPVSSGGAHGVVELCNMKPPGGM